MERWKNHPGRDVEEARFQRKLKVRISSARELRKAQAEWQAEGLSGRLRLRMAEAGQTTLDRALRIRLKWMDGTKVWPLGSRGDFRGEYGERQGRMG